MYEAAHVDKTRKGGLPEIKQFQEYLQDKGYQIVVYINIGSHGLIYKGPQNEKLLTLFLHDGHYDVIVAMPAFLRRSYFCSTCLKGYDQASRHNCVDTCNCCKSRHWKVGWCAVTVAGALRARNVWKTIGYHWLQKRNNPFVNCLGSVKIAIVCLMKDRVLDDVYEKIRESTNVTRCIASDVKHTWTETNICVLCSHSLISRRKMTLKAVRKKKTAKEPSKQKFIFFDFECRQDEEVDTNAHSSVFKHIPNLCMALRVCEDCYLNTEDVHANNVGFENTSFEEMIQ